jgi:transketolase C-terminal domain/subunit
MFAPGTPENHGCLQGLGDRLADIQLQTMQLKIGKST